MLNSHIKSTSFNLDSVQSLFLIKYDLHIDRFKKQKQKALCNSIVLQHIPKEKNHRRLNKFIFKPCRDRERESLHN